MVEGDSKSAADLPVVVFQSEAYFEEVFGGDEIGGGVFALRSVELEDEGFIGEGELDDVGAVAFLSGAEGGFGFGIETAQPCGEDFVDGVLALGGSCGNVDLAGGEALEGGEECGFGFGWSLKFAWLPGFRLGV